MVNMSAHMTTATANEPNAWPYHPMERRLNSKSIAGNQYTPVDVRATLVDSPSFLYLLFLPICTEEVASTDDTFLIRLPSSTNMPKFIIRISTQSDEWAGHCNHWGCIDQIFSLRRDGTVLLIVAQPRPSSWTWKVYTIPCLCIDRGKREFLWKKSLF